MKPRAPFSIPRSAAFMPLHRESRFDIREPQTIRPLKRRERRAPIPTGLRPPAQGCEARATLGHTPQLFSQPQRGCITLPPATRCNPVGVDFIFRGSPRVASRTRQPWAECGYPVGVNRQSVTNCHRLKSGGRRVSQLVTNCDQLKTGGIFITQLVTNCYQLKMSPNPCTESRQLVTKCYQLKTVSLSISQPVTNCNRLKTSPNPGNLTPSP